MNPVNKTKDSVTNDSIKVEKNAGTTTIVIPGDVSESKIQELIAALKVNPDNKASSINQEHPAEDKQVSKSKPSTDPLKVFPETILDKIFEEFEGETVRTASLVCKGWYETIGKSDTCMDMINLKVYKPTKKDVAIMLKTKRNYTHVMLACDSNHHRRFLTRFSNVKHLRFYYDVDNWDIELPRLESVLIAGRKIYKNGILSKVTKIRELEWILQDDLDKDFVSIMVDYLKTNSNLKALLVDDKNSDDVFMKIIKKESSNFKFKLESFWYTLKLSISPDEEKIMIKFLKSHAKSLKVISYDSPVPNSVLVSLLQDFPKLFNLALNTMWLDAPTLPRIRPNPNIKICQIFRPMPLKIKFLMPLMPNLEHLHVDKIRKNIDGVNMLELMMTLAPKSLKTIGYVNGNHEEIEEFFEAMKSTLEAFDENYDYDKLELIIVPQRFFLKSIIFNYDLVPTEPQPY